MVSINIELPKKIESQLNYLEIISKRPKSFFIQEALKRYWEDMEDIRDALESKKDEGKTYTTEELSQELGLK